MFLAAIVKEHAGSGAAVGPESRTAESGEPDFSEIAHEEAMTVEMTGVVAVPEDLPGLPAAAVERGGEARRARGVRSRWV
jgi:hypothetical protein